ncbi:MAG TPA: hypothetical protein VL972_04350 [Solirubrobacteraceae bacterium]|nr:hypothetical protein [Solirubrobacteraceae bacterium]
MPAAALASSGDAGATHAYLEADYALAQASKTNVAPAQAKVVAFAHRLRGECGREGSGAPQTEAEQPLTYEAAGALWSITYGANARPIGAFARAVQGLHWSQRKLTHTAQAYAKTLQGLATLSLPHLCADVAAWKASGFGPAPAATVSFDRHVEALEAHAIPLKLLAPYEDAADRALAQRTAGLETKLLNTETVEGYNDWDLVLETLGLPQ